MKKFSLLCCVAAFSFHSAHAAIFNFDFLGGQMDGAEQVGPVSTPAIGTSTGITYDDSSKLLSVNATFTGLSSSATAAHVHGPAAVGENAGVLISLTPTFATSGTISGSGTLSESQETDLFNQLLYVNLHNDNNPSGEIRGQLVPVPEPRQYAIIAALGGLGFAVWRRSQRREYRDTSI